MRVAILAGGVGSRLSEETLSKYVSENCRRASDVSGDESINVTAWRLPHAPRVVIPPI